MRLFRFSPILPLLLVFAMGRASSAQEPTTEPATPASEQPQASTDESVSKPKPKPKRKQRQNPDKNIFPEFEPVAAPPLAGLQQKQFFWFTMYPKFVVKFDPATDRIVQKIELVGGLFWRSRLSHDRKRLLVVTNQQQSIEVVDLQTGKLVGNHLFQEEGMILRVRSVRECPGGLHWLVQTDRVKKHMDRYSFEASEYLLYDSVQQKVVRKLKKLPGDLSRARLSADGNHWLAEKDGNLLFLDARTLEERDRIDLKTPRFFGAGALRLSRTDLLDGRDPNRAVMLFTTTDPVEKKRTNWGICELDLANKKIGKVIEWGPSKSSWGLRVAPTKRIGAMLSFSSRNKKRQLATYDLNTGKLLREAHYEFRPRRSLVAISPDAEKLYVGVAGSDFEIFDGNTLERRPSVELEGEISGTVYVVDG